MEQTAASRVCDAAPIQAMRRERGPYRKSTQYLPLNGALMRGLARIIRDRGITSPQMRGLLRQPETADGHLRDELAAIRSHCASSVTYQRLLVFCDALKADAGELIAADYATRATGRVH